MELCPNKWAEHLDTFGIEFNDTEALELLLLVKTTKYNGRMKCSITTAVGLSQRAPGLGKRSSKQFDQMGLEHVENSDDDEKDHSSQGEKLMNPIDMMTSC